MMAMLCAAASGVRENLKGSFWKGVYVLASKVEMPMAWRMCAASRAAYVGRYHGRCVRLYHKFNCNIRLVVK